MGIPSEKLDAMLRDPLGMADELDSLTANATEETPPAEETGEINAPTPSAEPKAPEAKEPAKAETPDAAPTDQGTTDEDGIDPAKAVVLTKDGKHQIPYSVLQRQRERNLVLERQLEESNAKLASLAQAKETGKADSTPEIERLSEDELKALEDEAPTIAKVLRGQYEAIDQLQAQVQTVTRKVVTDEQSRVRSAVDEAIDAVPKLAHVRETDVPAFNEIAAIDQMLRAQPRWAGKPMSERFAKAVAMYEAANGELRLPAGSDSGKGDLPDPKSKAREVIEKAGAAHPNTLTDLPGGNPPPRSEIEGLADLSGAALTNRLMSLKDPKDIDEFLSRL